MMKKGIKFLRTVCLLSCMLAMASCGQSAADSVPAEVSVAEGRSLSAYAGATESFMVVLEITSDSLLTCHNDFMGQDSCPLVLDITNPGFTDFLGVWFDSLTPDQLSRLKRDSVLLVSAGPNVSNHLLDKVKKAVKDIGLEKMSVAAF